MKSKAKKAKKVKMVFDSNLVVVVGMPAGGGSKEEGEEEEEGLKADAKGKV